MKQVVAVGSGKNISRPFPGYKYASSSTTADLWCQKRDFQRAEGGCGEQLRPVHAASTLCATYRGHTAAFSWLLATHLEVGIAKPSVVKEFTKLLERKGHREVLGVVPYWTLAGKVPHVGVTVR